MESPDAFSGMIISAMDPIVGPGKQIFFDRPLDLPNSNANIITNEVNHNDTSYQAYNPNGVNGVNGVSHTNGNQGFGFRDNEQMLNGLDDDNESDFEVPFRIYVDLGPEFPVEDVWHVIDVARRHILTRIRRSDYRHGPLDMANGNVLLFEAEIPATGLAMVDAASETEFVHRSLENWLLVLLDMNVQGSEIEIPFNAGYWHMAWCRH